MGKKKHTHLRKLLQKNSNKNHIYAKKAHIYKPKITNILKVTFFQVELPKPRETSALNSFSLSLHASISLFRLSHFVFVKKSFHPSFLREQFFLSINLSADFIFTN